MVKKSAGGSGREMKDKTQRGAIRIILAESRHLIRHRKQIKKKALRPGGFWEESNWERAIERKKEIARANPTIARGKETRFFAIAGRNLMLVVPGAIQVEKENQTIREEKWKRSRRAETEHGTS